MAFFNGFLKYQAKKVTAFARICPTGFKTVGINLESIVLHIASSTLTPTEVIYYAHTAEEEDGRRLPEISGKWQPLVIHLSNVADLDGQFGALFDLTNEARLAGLVHNS